MMINVSFANDDEMTDVYALRMDVFVREQGVPSNEELDSEDSIAQHIIAYDCNVPVACGRVIIKHKSAHIGRVAVKKSHRRMGIGSNVCRFIIDYALSIGCNNIWLNAQLTAIPFYQSLGFETVGEIFLDAGIEHKKMIYNAKKKALYVPS